MQKSRLKKALPTYKIQWFHNITSSPKFLVDIMKIYIYQESHGFYISTKIFLNFVAQCDMDRKFFVESVYSTIPLHISIAYRSKYCLQVQNN